MCLTPTFKNNFQNTKEKKNVWEAIFISKIFFFFFFKFTKITYGICMLQFFL